LFSDVKILIVSSKVVGSKLCILGCDFIDERSEKEIEKDEQRKKVKKKKK